MRYCDSTAFRQALEHHLKAWADGDGARLARDRKRVAFDRLLARLAVSAPGRWRLKGGHALELRLADRARATKDIDLDWHCGDDQFSELLDDLLTAASHDAGDYFRFTIERTDTAPERLGGSFRFRAIAEVAGRRFETFTLDVGRHDPIGSPDTLTTPGLLRFAGIDPVVISAMPVAQQAAEKLHAYTRTYPASQPSSRTKDLVDLVLISQISHLDASDLHRAVETTFDDRATHAKPSELPDPPTRWRAPYRQLARTVGIQEDLRTGHASAAELLDPILGGLSSGTWLPSTRLWAT